MNNLEQHYWNLPQRTKTANLAGLRDLARGIGKTLRTPVSELSKKEIALGGLGSLGAVAAAKGLAPELAMLPDLSAAELASLRDTLMAGAKSEVSPSLFNINNPSAYINRLAETTPTTSKIDSILRGVNKTLVDRLPQVNKKLTSEAAGLLSKAQENTRNDLLEYMYTKALIPGHERLVNLTPVSDLLISDATKGALKAMDTSTAKMIAESKKLPELAKKIVNREYPGYKNIQQALNREGMIPLYNYKAPFNIPTLDKLNDLATYNAQMKDIISSGVPTNPLNQLMSKLRQIPQEARGGIPDISSAFSRGAAAESGGVLADAGVDKGIDLLTKSTKKLKKVPIGKLIGVAESAIDAYKSRGILDSLAKYKDTVNLLEAKTLGSGNVFRLPRGVQDLIGEATDVGYDSAARATAADVAKSIVSDAKGVAKGTEMAQQARYGVNSPLIF